MREGKISQEDVSSPIHKAILVASYKILEHLKDNPENGIPIDLLCNNLKSMIKIGQVLESEKDVLILELEKIYEMDMQIDYYRSIIPSFLSEVKIKKLINSYKPGDHRNFLSKAVSIEEISSVAGQNQIEFSPLLNPVLTTDIIEVVPCGISTIDSRMFGGLGKQELGIICGMTGLGKTTLAINFCWGAAATKKAVLITLEIPEKKIRERLYSRVAQVDYNRIRNGDNGDKTVVNQEVYEAISVIPDHIKRNFRVLDFSMEKCTVKKIEKQFMIWQQNDDLPDMVFLDWLDALNTDPTERNQGHVNKELRHVLQNYSEQCSELARKYNLAFWATTQSNGAGDGKREIRMTNSSEGFSKSHRCSVFLGIGATDEDRQNGRLTVKAGKMRDGRIFEAQIQARLDKQTFEDISPDLEWAAPGAANFTPVNERQNT